jgi:hypothetical protein
VSVEERAEPSRLAAQHALNGMAKRLALSQSTLTDLLDAIDDDSRLMDASLADAHRFVEEIFNCVAMEMFGPDGPLSPSAHQREYNAFKRARFDENDMFEVYADDLERYRKRQMKDLGVAESDSDRLILVRRRRVYISKLKAFQARASAALAICTNLDLS